MPTIMDKTLEKDDYIMFQAGTYQKVIRMSIDGYRKRFKKRFNIYSSCTTAGGIRGKVEVTVQPGGK